MPTIAVTVFANDPGNFFLEDDGIPGNDISRVRRPIGAPFTFGHPTDDLFFTPNVAGVILTIDLTDPLGTSRFTAGSLTDPSHVLESIGVRNLASDAGVTMAATLKILESGSDSAADIEADTLVLSAGTGIGSASNPLETQVGTLEAETTTGGISIRNFGAVTIGGLSPDVNGLSVATSGNVLLENFGTIILSDSSGLASIKGGGTSGSVTLIAKGIDSGIVSSINQDAISAPRGNITLTAGLDIGFGVVVTDLDNDVRANGTITVNAGRDFLIDGLADMVSDDFGLSTGGDVIVNAGRDIGVLAAAGTDASIVANGDVGADIILTTGLGGALTLNSGDGTAPGASLVAISGDVVANADRILIGTSGAISASAGKVVLRPVLDGLAMDLGSATDSAFALELSDAELDHVFTPHLFLGGPDAGGVTVSASISPLNAPDVTIQSGTDIVVKAGVTVQATGSLQFRAGDDILLIAGSGVVAGGSFSGFVDFGNTDPGTGGTAFVNAGFLASVRFTGEADSDTLFGGEANDILDGAGGADTLTGRLGDDTYEVDNSGDTVIEASSEGTDLVRASVSHVLATNVENLILTGSADINGTGNDLDNALSGNGGDNELNGGVGADKLVGGDGDDTYTVDNVGDTVVEASSAGIDLVRSSITFSLGGKQVENLTLTGADSINGTGNSFVNSITGNSGNNVLSGAGGADTMTGLGGNDSYIVDNAGDSVVEASGGGTDLVQSSVSFTLGGQFVENLTLSGSANINGTGNSLANTIVGNTGNNFLNGATGSDSLTGGAGGDTFVFKSTLGATNIDSIGDFNVADDTIQLDSAIFNTIVGTGSLSLAQFIANSTGTAGDASDRIVYETDTGKLFFDSNGSAAGGSIQFAEISAGLALTASDFFVV